jgi:hypothetical protein
MIARERAWRDMIGSCVYRRRTASRSVTVLSRFVRGLFDRSHVRTAHCAVQCQTGDALLSVSESVMTPIYRIRLLLTRPVGYSILNLTRELTSQTTGGPITRCRSLVPHQQIANRYPLSYDSNNNAIVTQAGSWYLLVS